MFGAILVKFNGNQEEFIRLPIARLSGLYMSLPNHGTVAGRQGCGAASNRMPKQAVGSKCQTSLGDGAGAIR